MNFIQVTVSLLIYYVYQSASAHHPKPNHLVYYIHNQQNNTIRIITNIKKQPHTHCYWYRNANRGWHQKQTTKFPRKDAIIDIPNLSGQLRIECYVPPKYYSSYDTKWTLYARTKGIITYKQLQSDEPSQQQQPINLPPPLSSLIIQSPPNYSILPSPETPATEQPHNLTFQEQIRPQIAAERVASAPPHESTLHSSVGSNVFTLSTPSVGDLTITNLSGDVMQHRVELQEPAPINARVQSPISAEPANTGNQTQIDDAAPPLQRTQRSSGYIYKSSKGNLIVYVSDGLIDGKEVTSHSPQISVQPTVNSGNPTNQNDESSVVWGHGQLSKPLSSKLDESRSLYSGTKHLPDTSAGIVLSQLSDADAVSEQNKSYDVQTIMMIVGLGIVGCMILLCFVFVVRGICKQMGDNKDAVHLGRENDMNRDRLPTDQFCIEVEKDSGEPTKQCKIDGL